MREQRKPLSYISHHVLTPLEERLGTERKKKKKKKRGRSTRH